MRAWGECVMRPIAGCLVLVLLFPFVSAGAQTGQNAQAGAPTTSSQARNAEQSQPDALPNSPGSSLAQNNNPQSSSPQTANQQQAQEPVGTAAAGSVETTGVAASKPAGAAIAPAKQRRTRALLIKVSAIVGAGVAIGTVAALSNASPSRPPGAK